MYPTTPGVVLAPQDRIMSWDPDPDRDTVCGLPAPLSVTAKDATRLPVAVGVNITAILQLDPAASELPQVSFSVKSPALVPEIARLLIASAALPVFVSVIDCDELVISMG